MSDHQQTADWRPVQRTRTFEAVLDRIDERIAAGELRVGDRLPGERQLASLLGVSRPSVREAMRVLEARGVLTAQTGSGPDAGAILVADPGRGLSGLVGTHLGLAAFDLADVVEARWAVERLAVETAARDADPSQLAPLRETVERMGEPSLPLAEFHQLDTTFHIGLAELAGNPLLVAFMRAIRESVHRYASQAVEEMSDTSAGVAALNDDHGAILTALENGDAPAAVEALDTHLRRAYPQVDRPR